MRALRLVAFGSSPRFEMRDAPEPVPAAGEVVVDLRAAALNHRDPWVWQTPEYCRLPVTLGSDGAGVVSVVGPGVEEVAVGDPVVINPTLGWGDDDEVPGVGFDILGAPLDGTFAERVVIPAANVAPKPAGWSFEEAAALSLGGLTAWRATVTCAGAAPGRSLLVTGIGGGVASFAVQIAAAVGARVFVTSSSQEKIDRARGLGATEGFIYTDPGWPDQLRAILDDGVDAVVDSFGGGTWRTLLPVLKVGGRLVTLGDTGGAEENIDATEVYWQWRSIRGTTMGSPREYRALLDHVASVSWRPVIDSIYPLEEIAAAAQRLEAPDRFGKVVLRVRPGSRPAEWPRPAEDTAMPGAPSGP